MASTTETSRPPGSGGDNGTGSLKEPPHHYVVAGRDRRLAVDTWGDPNGTPVFLMHGTPGSRLGPRPRVAELYRRGIRLISYDRPGYGHSDRLIKRQVKDAAEDVTLIAEWLGLGRFSVVGRSGGGAHALAVAALLPERVDRVAAMVSLAPREAEGLDWYADMIESNVAAYERADEEAYEQFVEGLLRDRRAPIAGTNGDAGHLIEELNREWDESDRIVVSDSGIRVQLRRTYSEALRYDSEAGGWVDDVLALTRDWGFRPEDIPSQVKTLLWHGQRDRYSPPGHTRWLGEHIKHATVVVEEEAAHFMALTRLPEVLTWAASED